MRIINLNSRADTCARICVIALGFSIPISVALDNILLAVLLVAWIASGDFRGKFSTVRDNPVALAVLALFGLLVLGLAYGTRNPGDGLQYIGKYIDLLCMPVFLTLFRDPRTRELGLRAFLVAVMINLLASHLAAQGLLYDNPVLIRAPQSPSGFKFSITHSLLMSYAAFQLVLLAREERRGVLRILYIVLALAAAHNIFLMVLSRTGYVVLTVLLLYFFVVTFKWRGVVTAMALSSVLIFTAYVGSDRFQQRVDRAQEEITAWRANQTADTSVGVRMDFYLSSLQIIREHPVFGAGTGSFPAAFAATDTGKHLAAAFNPHNEYLLIASQIGLCGLACMIFLFCLQWRLAGRLLPPIYRDLARGLVLMFVTGCMFNSFLLDHTEGLLFAWAGGLFFAGLKPPAIVAERVA